MVSWLWLWTVHVIFMKLIHQTHYHKILHADFFSSQSMYINLAAATWLANSFWVITSHNCSSDLNEIDKHDSRPWHFVWDTFSGQSTLAIWSVYIMKLPENHTEHSVCSFCPVRVLVKILYIKICALWKPYLSTLPCLQSTIFIRCGTFTMISMTYRWWSRLIIW